MVIPNSWAISFNILSARCSFLNSFHLLLSSLLDTFFKLKFITLAFGSTLTTFATYCLLGLINFLISCTHLPAASEMCIIASRFWYSSSEHHAANWLILLAVQRTSSPNCGYHCFIAIIPHSMQRY